MTMYNSERIASDRAAVERFENGGRLFEDVGMTQEAEQVLLTQANLIANISRETAALLFAAFVAGYANHFSFDEMRAQINDFEAAEKELDLGG